MDNPKCDYHIHCKYLGCANETMEIPAIVETCEKLGVSSLAITDHLNSLEKVSEHLPIIEDIKKLDTNVDIYLGVELNFTGCDEGFAFNEEIKEQYGFQFAIGGIHGTYIEKYDLRKIIEIQHRHHLKTCEDQLVQVLVHPYWFWKGEFEKKGFPWFESMKVVPESLTRELGQVAKETGTAIEINGWACLSNEALPESYVEEYFDYLSILADEGASFSLGSDSHDISKLATINKCYDMVERLGLPEDRIWHPQCEPMKSPAKN